MKHTYPILVFVAKSIMSINLNSDDFIPHGEGVCIVRLCYRVYTSPEYFTIQTGNRDVACYVSKHLKSPTWGGKHHHFHPSSNSHACAFDLPNLNRKMSLRYEKGHLSHSFLWRDMKEQIVGISFDNLWTKTKIHFETCVILTFWEETLTWKLHDKSKGFWGSVL